MIFEFIYHIADIILLFVSIYDLLKYISKITVCFENRESGKTYTNVPERQKMMNKY